MLLGGLTLVVGDDQGVVHGLFAATDPGAGTPDSRRLVEAHRFGVSDAPVTALVPASRDRLILAADDAGRATLVHMTSHKRVVRVRPDQAGDSAGAAVPLAGAALSPRGDSILLATADGRLHRWSVSLGHPQASWHALFGKPLYEGNLEGSYVYQSSAGSDRAELKNSLVPLLFGTMKATVFATLLAIPLAVLAAVYTSEFLSPRTRRVVKPVIELMASLPSVVLGFVAAMVLAPILAAWLPSVLACLVSVPIAVLLGAHLWQMAPPRLAARARGGRQIALVALWGALGVGAGVTMAPALESLLFGPSRADTLVRAGSFEPVPADQVPAWIGSRPTLSPAEQRTLRDQGLAFRAGRVVRPVEPAPDQAAAVEQTIREHALDRADLRAWLDGTIGGPTPGWIVVCFPPAMVAAWVLVHGATRRVLGRVQAVSPLADVLRFLGILASSVVLAVGAAVTLSAAGLDPRDSILGPFSVRNSLVVGIIMGFAIIPIIYTISEDALRGVPNALRLASLGAGATPWQTSVRIVLPVAASGIFSACMIGLGRAVGETMIVLMATGNSPEMSWNIFSGFRTLAANIAVELPESDKGSTHYRLLFLCGLLLFAFTFIINTTAEVVRQAFRRRNANL
jgi:phosphate transport system permease protein